MITSVRRILVASAIAITALAGPVAAADAKPRKCSAVQREFFPWQCR